MPGNALLVCGSRQYSKFQVVWGALQRERSRFTYLVEGGAHGADVHAKHAAIVLRLPYKEYRADWETYGRAAGPLRNELMLEENSRIIEVWAFVAGGTGQLYKSRGTLDMVSQALRRRLTCRIYGERPFDFRLAVWHNGRVEVVGADVRVK